MTMMETYVILLTCKRQSRRWSQAFLVYRDQADLSLRTLDKILGDEEKQDHLRWI